MEYYVSTVGPRPRRSSYRLGTTLERGHSEPCRSLFLVGLNLDVLETLRRVRSRDPSERTLVSDPGHGLRVGDTEKNVNDGEKC